MRALHRIIRTLRDYWPAFLVLALYLVVSDMDYREECATDRECAAREGMNYYGNGGKP